MIELNGITNAINMQVSQKSIPVANNNEKDFLEILKSKNKSMQERHNNLFQEPKKNMQHKGTKLMDHVNHHSTMSKKPKTDIKITDEDDGTQQENCKVYELIQELICLLQQQGCIEENELKALEEELIESVVVENLGNLLKVLEIIEGYGEIDKNILGELKEKINLESEIGVDEEFKGISKEAVKEKFEEFLKTEEDKAIQTPKNLKEDEYITATDKHLDKKEAPKQQKASIEGDKNIITSKPQETMDANQHLEALGLEKELQVKVTSMPYETLVVDEVYSSAFLEEISYKIFTSFKNGKNQMSLQLLPENLGKISIDLSSNNQEVKAKVYVESLQVKEVIESNLNQFRESLREKGINILTIEVTVGQDANDFQQNKNFTQQKMKFRRPLDQLHSVISNEELGTIKNINPYIVTTDFDKFG